MTPQHATIIQEDWLKEEPIKTIGVRQARPLGPPPFYLETEIRHGSTWGSLLSLAVGLGVLLSYLALLWPSDVAYLSLGRFMLFAFSAGCWYLTVRFVSYWGSWGFAAQKYQVIGTVHPASRGELPRNWFILVRVAPSIALTLLLVLMYLVGIVCGPEVWLAIAVVSGTVLRDLKAVWRLMRVNAESWILQTKSGLDVLRPIDPSQVREFQRTEQRKPPSLRVSLGSSAIHRYL